MDGFVDACREGKLELVSAVVHWFDRQERSLALVDACEAGHEEVIKLLVAEGVDDTSTAFEAACRVRNWTSINLLVTLGVNTWEAGLKGACVGGHRDVVDFMLARGARWVSEATITACDYGHLDLAKFLMTLGVAEWVLHYAMKEAGEYGKTDIVAWLLTIPTMTEKCRKEGLLQASRNDWLNVVTLIVPHADRSTISSALFTAVKFNNSEIILFLLTHVPEELEMVWALGHHLTMDTLQSIFLHYYAPPSTRQTPHFLATVNHITHLIATLQEAGVAGGVARSHICEYL